MTIAVLHRYPAGEIKGTNPSFDYFLDELKKRGHQPRVITFKKFNRASNVEKWAKSILFLAAAPLAVLLLRARCRVDLVYCDDSLPFYAWLVKCASGLPVVMRLGDLQTAYMFYDKGCIGRVCYRLLHAVEKFTWRRIDRIIAISESFKVFLLKEGISPSKIAVVEESIDADRFYKEADGSAIREKYGIGSSPLVMFHGLVAGIKGLDILLTAMPDALKVFPDLKLMIVGDGPDLARLRRLAARLSISRSVIFTGWVPFKDIPSYIAACDIGVPVRSANLGNNFVVTTAYLQYALLKRPVTVPDLACFKDIARDNPRLKLFFLKNPATLSEALIYLLRNKKEATESAGINYKIAVERFNARDIAAKLASELDMRRS